MSATEITCLAALASVIVSLAAHVFAVRALGYDDNDDEERPHA